MDEQAMAEAQDTLAGLGNAVLEKGIVDRVAPYRLALTLACAKTVMMYPPLALVGRELMRIAQGIFALGYYAGQRDGELERMAK